METLYEAPLRLYPPDKPGAFQAASKQMTNIVRSKKGRHTKHKAKPPKTQIIVGGQTWAQWRRAWFGFMTHLWTHTLTPTQRAFWTAQASIVPYINYRNLTGNTHGKNFFCWYQFRCFDLHVDEYIPFPENAANFPYQFVPPWSPPTIELPTVLYADLAGIVTVYCLNQLSPAVLLEPWCCFMRHPPVQSNASDDHPEWIPTLATVRHPWYYFDRYDEDDYSYYIYDLSTMFRTIKPGTRAALIHSYGNPTGGSIPSTPLYPATVADSGGSDTPWFNPMDARTIDYQYATLMTPGPLINTNALRATDFGFDIPVDAEIKGIRLRVYPWTPNTTVWDRTVQLMKAGVVIGQNKASPDPWPQNTTYPHEYGNAADLWGTTWTRDDINDPGFGASLTAKLGPGYSTAMVDAFQITVWYTAPGGWFTPLTQTNFTFS